MIWWLHPSRIRPVVVGLLVGITLLEVLIRDNGPMNVLLEPSHVRLRSYPLVERKVAARAGDRRRADPLRGNTPAKTCLGSEAGVNRT